MWTRESRVIILEVGQWGPGNSFAGKVEELRNGRVWRTGVGGWRGGRLGWVWSYIAGYIMWAQACNGPEPSANCCCPSRPVLFTSWKSQQTTHILLLFQCCDCSSRPSPWKDLFKQSFLLFYLFKLAPANYHPDLWGYQWQFLPQNSINFNL